MLKQFAATRKGDRLGLILFGDAAFLQAPFTADLDTWQTLLQETDVAMAGQSTHLGMPSVWQSKCSTTVIATGNKTRTAPSGRKSPSSLPMATTPAVLSARGCGPGSRGQRRAAAYYRHGDPATVGEQALDLDTLQQLATLTGGQLFQALDEAQLTRAYQVIGELEPQRYESTRFQTRESLHHYLIAVSVGLYLTLFSLLTLRRYRLRTALSGDTP